MLDNAADADQVRPLLPGSPGSAVIVTTRNQLTGLVAAEGAHSLFVDLLTRAEARLFLKRRLGADRVETDLRAVDEIIIACARLPLALSIVAARAAVMPKGFPLGALAAELREAQGLLDAFDGDDDATNVRAVFSWSYHRLSEQAERLFRLLGWHPGPSISIPAAASLAGVPASQVRRTLRQLAGAHLVEESDPGRFAFHDLLRAYAAEQTERVDADADRRAATQRVLDHYLHTAHRAGYVVYPHREDTISLVPAQPGIVIADVGDRALAVAWFVAEHAVILAILRQAADLGFDRHVYQLAWALAPYFDYHGHWHDFADTQQAAVHAARRLDDGYAVALTSRLLGVSSGRLGRYDQGLEHLQHALAEYRRLDDFAGQAHVHRNSAAIYDEQNRYRDGLEHARQALELFRSADDRVGEGRAMNAVGWFHIQLGEEERGLSVCRQALELQRSTDHRYGQAETLDSLGYAYYRLGHFDESISAFERAIEVYQVFDDRYSEANALAHLGDTLYAAGDLDAAAAAWRRALSILRQLGHPDADVVHSKLNGVAVGEVNLAGRLPSLS